jgi:hypothetical protein
MPDIRPAKVELDSELIKVTDTVGLTHWYRVTPDGCLEEGAPITVTHRDLNCSYTIHLFMPRIAGLPLLMPTVRKVEHHGSH